jgi:integrase
MARIKLTKAVVASLPTPEQAQAFVWDSVLKGFGVRVSCAGVKTYVAQFKVRGGKERRMAVGRCDRVALDKARIEASKLISAADLGGDPATERREARNVSEDQNPLFKDFAAHWLEDVAKRKNRDSTLKHRRLLLDNHVLPELGNKRLSEITQRHIEEMHHKVSKAFPVAANRTVSLCSAIFSTAVRWGLVSDNPALGIERNVEHGRERYLTLDEIMTLQTALDESPLQNSADTVRVLMLTGARVGEVLCMRWDHLDLKEGVWVKPAATTKQNKIHRVPLSPPVIDLLKARFKKQQSGKKRDKSDWVFPGKSKQGHMTTIRTFWAAVCKRAKIKGVRIHDLRHTFASLLVSSGESLPVVGALLGHTQAKTTSRYAHLLDGPLRSASDRVAEIASKGKM